MGNENRNLLPLTSVLSHARSTSPLKRLLVGLGFLTFIILALGLYYVQQIRTQSRQQAETQSKAMAVILQQSIGVVFQKIDLTVLNVVDEVAHQSAMGGIQSEVLLRFIEKQFQRHPELDALRITDANGMVTIGTGLVSTVPVNLSDRDYFIYLRDHPASGLVISKPIRGKISNNWVLSCARRITLKDGTFAGVAFGSITVQYLRDLMPIVPVGKQGSISLRWDDLMLITRYAPGAPAEHEGVTGSAAISTAWQNALAQGQIESGSYTTDSVIDGTRRIFSYRRLSPYPLYVNVGLSLEEVLAEAQQELLSLFGFLTLFLGMSGLLVWQVQRNWQKTVASEQVLKRNIERLELMQEVNQYQAANIQDLLDFALEKVLTLTESHIGYIYHYQEETQQFTLNTWSKNVMPACTVAEPLAVYHLDSTGIWGEVVRQRQPVLDNDFAAPSALKKGYPKGHVLLTRFLSVPVFENDKIVAVVGVANKVAPYDHSDLLQLTLMMEGVWRITARITLEERVRRAAHEWQTTFDAITDSVSFIDTNQRIIRCNKATAELTGFDFPAILGKHCWEIVHGTTEPLPDCPMTRSLQTAKSETMTFQRNNRWLEVTVDPILGEDGVLSGAVQVVRDVTDKIQAAQSLRDNQELFALFMKYSPIYTFIKEVTATESRVLQASDNFIQMVGIPAADMVGKTMRQLFPEEFADKITLDDQLVVASKQVVRLEEDLHGRHHITYKFPIECGDGKRLLAGYTIDITELKQTQNSLQASRSLLAATAAAARMGGWEIDLCTNTHVWTEETCRIHEVEPGFTPTMASALEFYAPESIPIITEAVQRAIENDEPFDLELNLITAKGRRRLVHAIGKAEFVDGKAVKLSGTFQDIHDQRQAEQKLHQMQAQVIQQEKLATIGQLAAGVAHEINNPVGYIKSNLVSLEKYTQKIFAYLAKEKEAADRYLPKAEHAELASLWRSAKLDFISEDLLDLIHESMEGIERVRKIVQDLVSFSRRQGDELAAVDVNQCLESTLAIAWNEIKHQAELRRELTPVPDVMANSQKLSQVFLNLLINASHAVAPGGIITLRTWQDGESVCIAVADNGCGIPLEIREKIFEPFYTTKEIGKGTGLGLAISNDVITKFGGSIELESEVGVGTTFTVRLPITTAE